MSRDEWEAQYLGKFVPHPDKSLIDYIWKIIKSRRLTCRFSQPFFKSVQAQQMSKEQAVQAFITTMIQFSDIMEKEVERLIKFQPPAPIVIMREDDE